MLPNPASGWLAYQLFPPSSLIAMIPAEYVSEYSGNRIRFDGSTVGLHLGCHPSRDESLSLIASRSLSIFAFTRASSIGRPGIFNRASSALVMTDSKSFGLSRITPCHSHSGGPSAV